MERDELFKQAVRASALGQGETAKSLTLKIDDSDSQAYFIFVSAFFAGIAEHWFREDQSQEAIARFVNEMRNDFAHADPPVKPLVVEGVLRALFGEDHLLDDITGMEQLTASLDAIRKMVDQSDHIQEHLNDYLNDAQILAAAWATETQ